LKFKLFNYFAFILYLYSINAIAADYNYSTSGEAANACRLASGSDCLYPTSINLSFCSPPVSGGQNGLDYSYYNPPNPHYRGCVAGSSCPSGQSPNLSTGVCEAVACPQYGTPRVIAFPYAELQAGNWTGNTESYLDLDTGHYSNHTVVLDGAEYQTHIPDSFAGSCYFESGSTGSISCTYNAEATGNCPTTGNTAKAPSSGKTPAQSSVKPNTGDVCLTDPRGNTVCNSSPDQNKKCGEINGAKICFDTTPGVGTVNGQAYQTSDKNCGLVNGSPVCVSSDASSPTTVGCISNGGVKNCVNKDVKIESEITQTRNPDGSVTSTRRESDNIIGHKDNTIVTTQNPDGSVTTHHDPGEVGTGSGVASGSQGSSCPGCATEDTQKGVKGKLDEIARDGAASKGFLEKIWGFFDTTGLSNQIDSSGETSGIENAYDDQLAQSQGLKDGVTDSDFFHLADIIDIFPVDSACQGLDFSFKGSHYYWDPCAKLQTARDILGWLLLMFTVYYIMGVMIRKDT